MFRTIKVALLLAPLVGVAACGDAAEETTLRTDAEAVAALRAAPDAATEAESARFELTMSTGSPDGAVDIVSTGAYDGDQLAMTMDFGTALAGLAQASGETVPDGFDEPMEVVIDGDQAYLRVPMLDALTGRGGWFTASLEELAESGGSLGFGEGRSDPSRLLEMLRGVTDGLEEVGREDVRGVATTHLTAVISVAKALEEATADQRAALKAQMDGFGVAELPVDVWVDGAGLVRRMVLDLTEVVSSARGDEGRATLTIELFDYGEDVDIEVPAADEVTPLSEILGSDG
ncbi:MAG: hypothetical protein ABWZ76_02315 [Acidimicrobiales bacterium]